MSQEARVSYYLVPRFWLHPKYCHSKKSPNQQRVHMIKNVWISLEFALSETFLSQRLGKVCILLFTYIVTGKTFSADRKMRRKIEEGHKIRFSCIAAYFAKVAIVAASAIAVFPAPVGAQTKTELPFRKSWTASFWKSSSVNLKVDAISSRLRLGFPEAMSAAACTMIEHEI